MAASTPSTIILKNQEHVLYEEYQAAGTITPGHLIAVGSAGTVAVHAVLGGSAPEKLFALEDDAQGRSITDNYDSSTYKTVRCAICQPGVEVYAILGLNQTIVIGDAVESLGDGTMRKHIAQTSVAATSPLIAGRTGQIIGHAKEAVTTTSATARLTIRIV